MEYIFISVALFGAIIGEAVRVGARKQYASTTITNILASSFLAILLVYFLQSFDILDNKTLISLSGILSFLGDYYTRRFCIKIVNNYFKESKKENKNAKKEL